MYKKCTNIRGLTLFATPLRRRAQLFKKSPVFFTLIYAAMSIIFSSSNDNNRHVVKHVFSKMFGGTS